MSKYRWIVAAVIAASFVAQSQADVLAHWRFEEGAFNQGAGPDVHLTLSGSPSRVALPAVGAGSDFADPIPLTSDANGSAASTSAGNTFVDNVQQSPWSRAHWDSMRGSFTVELMFNSPTGDAGYLVSRWGNSEQQWGVGLRDGYVRVALNGSGATTAMNFEELSFEAGKDYYLAVVYAGNQGVTARLDNLTDGGSQTQTLSGYPGWLTYASWAVPVRVGGLSNGTNGAASAVFTGMIDEVRISDSVVDLATEGLMVPEPATLGLLAVGGLGLVRRRRR